MTNFSLENQYGGPVLGVDEVGRGPLAGPVVAAAVHIPDEIKSHPYIEDIKDSKKLSKGKLAILNDFLHEHCHVAISSHSPTEIDTLNILQASLSAMRLACLKLISIAPICALIDGNKVPKDMPINSVSIIKGDQKSKSIAAASIVAKFYRDKIMLDLHEQYPHYGWNTNVGYPTPKHREAIAQYGITEHHRRSFKPVRDALDQVHRPA